MFTICIPTYNRDNMVIESFVDIINHNLVDEIIILDDFSNEKIFISLKEKIINLNNPKIKLHRNEKNLKAFLNKLEVVKLSQNDWVILLDSDNKLTTSYLNSIPQELDINTFYLPNRGICDSPNLDYREYNNVEIDKVNYKKLVTSNNSKLDCLFNTGNYVFNKNIYLKSVEDELSLLDPIALDPFYQIFLGFKHNQNFKLKIIEGMEYYHRLHNNQTNESGSYYTNNSHKSMEIHSYLKSKIIDL